MEKRKKEYPLWFLAFKGGPRDGEREVSWYYLPYYYPVLTRSGKITYKLHHCDQENRVAFYYPKSRL